MKNMSENQGKPRTMSDYYSPKGKVKDYLGCPMQQCSPSQLTYFQESPMQPSQVQNRLSLSLTKRMLSRQSHKALTQPKTRSRDSISSPKVAKPAEHCQNNAFRGQKETAQTASSVKVDPARSNCSLLKRCKDIEEIDSSLKKQCLKNLIPGTVQTQNCIASQSQHLAALSSSSSSDLMRLELSPEKTKTNLAKEPTSNQSVRLITPPQLNPSGLSSSSSSDWMRLELSPEETTTNLAKEPSSNQSVRLMTPPHLNPKSSPDSSPRRYISSRLPGVGKAHMVKVTEDYVYLRSPGNSFEDRLRTLMKAKSRECVRSSDCQLRMENGSTTVQDSKDSSISSNGPLASHQIDCSQRSNSSAHVKLPCIDEESGVTAVKSTTTGPLSSHTGQRRSSTRRPAVIPDDLGDLFTPDPLTSVSNPNKAVVRPAAEQGKLGPHTTEGDCFPGSAAATSHTPSTESPNFGHLTASVTVKDAKFASHPKLPILMVKLERLNMGLHSISLASGLKIPVLPNKHDSEPVEVHPDNRTPTKGDALPAAEGMVEEEMELGLDLFFGLDIDESESSEDEQLPSLQEMMQAKTPEKRAFPKPPTPILSGRHIIPNNSTTTALSCRNNLDQMLKEIRSIKRSKEKETVLLSSCREYDLREAEREEDEENNDGAITSEQQEFLQRFPVVSSTIRDVHPGEVVFNLESCGRLFSQHTLQLRHCTANPQGTTQKTLLWSSPAQLSLHVRIGMFRDAYDFSPCPPQVTCFLFKMMSVHTERMISDKILQDLCFIARSAANHIVKNGSQTFEVWVPSVADVTLVLLNMGASFVTLFPLEKFQPPFSEGDLLEDKDNSSDSPSSHKKQSTFPKHNYSNVLKYLSYCMALCPRAFSDPELLLLLALSSRLGLEVHFTLEPHIDLRCLQRHIVSNVRDWEDMLPRMCLALTELTADHHNMCCLVQLLPDHTRGKELRRHLSVCMISKLLDGSCTYKPSVKEFQLSYLKPYLSRMKPSSLHSSMLSSCSGTRQEREDNMDTLDQQTYYLCYSLLTLVNQASNYSFFQPFQKEQLLELCYELDRHIKRDMNENDKCLYRNKVNDLVARIYTKWWMLVQRIRPLNDKLHDFWKPSPQDMLSSSARTESEEEGDVTDHPGLPSDKEDEMVQDMDEEEPTCAMGNSEETEQINGPTGGEAFTAGAMEQS